MLVPFNLDFLPKTTYYFSKSFKKVTGISPLEYRKKQYKV